MSVVLNFAKSACFLCELWINFVKCELSVVKCALYFAICDVSFVKYDLDFVNCALYFVKCAPPYFVKCDLHIS